MNSKPELMQVKNRLCLLNGTRHPGSSMKYFTKEMWRGWNSRDEAERQHANELSDRNWPEYRQQLEKLESRLGLEAYEFFKSGERHDGRLISFTVGDAINHDVHGPVKVDINAHDTTVEIKLLSPYLNTLYTCK